MEYRVISERLFTDELLKKTKYKGSPIGAALLAESMELEPFGRPCYEVISGDGTKRIIDLYFEEDGKIMKGNKFGEIHEVKV